MQTKLEKYAQLLIEIGIHLKKDQLLIINSDVKCAQFARVLSKKAFQAGASDVIIHWSDEESSQTRMLLGKDELFDEVYPWTKSFYLETVRRDAAYLSILADDPDIYKDVDPMRFQRYGKVFTQELKEYRQRLMTNVNCWCVASVPTSAWAKKVFPDLEEAEAMEALWEAIYSAVRINEENPVAAWQKHVAALKKQAQFLNTQQFAMLKYSSENGTDFTLELPKNHIWLGGSDLTADGHEFIANMPTEEIFTAPYRTGVNGRVVSSMPLNHNGQMIEEFELTFQDGKVVSYKAEVGEEVLKSIVETDEGAAYLGEVALVPYDSPISNTGILFYNSLFDENAACHLALGKAYPVCIQDGENLSKEDLFERGINESATHVDFMIGTKDLNITGVTQDGEEIAIFRNGNFVI